MAKSNVDNAEDVTPVVLDRNFNLRDLFMYRVKEHGLCFLKGIIQGYRGQMSMIEWIDFLVDEKRFLNKISYLEKRVLDNFYGVKATPFLYVIMTFKDCREYKTIINSIAEIKVTTSQWFSWYTKPIYCEGVIYDFLNTYSKVLPSKYKPPLYTVKSPASSPGVIYYNDFSSIKYRMRSVVIPSSVLNKDYEIIYPPNFFGVGDAFKHYLLFDSKDISELDDYEVIIRKYKYILSRIKTRGYRGKLIFPILKLDRGSLKTGFMVKEHDKISFYTPIYESENYIINQSRRYRSNKRFTLYFKFFWSRIMRKGLALALNIIFMEYKVTQSRLYPELTYGGKVYYSASSKIGYKII